MAASTIAGDGHTAAYAAGYLGAFALQRGEVQTAEQWFRQARAGCAAAGDSLGVAWCDFNLSFVLLARTVAPATVEATEALERAVDIGHEQGSDVLVSHASAALAVLVAAGGDGRRARRLADAAVAAARRLGLRHVLAMALVRAAGTAVLAGDHPSAEAPLADALATIADLGGRMWVSDSLELAGVLLERRGDAEPAIRLLSAATGRASAAAAGGYRPLQAVVSAARARAAAALDAEAVGRQTRLGGALSTADAIADAVEALSRARPEPTRVDERR